MLRHSPLVLALGFVALSAGSILSTGHALSTEPLGSGSSVRAPLQVHAEAEVIAPTVCDTGPYWVLFYRPCNTVVDLASLAREISQAAWARRSLAGCGLPDSLDLPVDSSMVASVAEHGHVRHTSRWFHGVSADLDEAARESVSRLPFVKQVWPVRRGRLAGIEPVTGPAPVGHQSAELGTLAGETTPYGSSKLQLDESRIPEVHELGFTGNQVRVMVLDTGFRKGHEAFDQTEILEEWDFVSGDGETENEEGDPIDAQDHGTRVWSIVGGYKPGVLVGSAFGSTFVLAKIEDVSSETLVEEDRFVAALEWADLLGVQVANASVNYDCFDDGLCYGLEEKDGNSSLASVAIGIAAARGILVVNSIGNYGEGESTLGVPADGLGMIAVGAVDTVGIVASFSARGPTFDDRIKPEVVARGTWNWSAVGSGADMYGHAFGTSFATPIVSGGAALLFEAHPEWDAWKARQAILYAADWPGPPNNDYGWGQVRIADALHWEPLIYPFPFDLESPSSGVVVPEVPPTFRWNHSADPDSQNPLVYTLRVGLNESSMATFNPGSDSTFTLPFALQPGGPYIWEITAEDVDGLRRRSRQMESFVVEETSSAPGQGPRSVEAYTLQCGPNPFRDHVEFQVSPPGGGGLEVRSASWAIYSPVGRRMAFGHFGARDNGVFVGSWNGLDRSGRRVPAGVFYLETTVGTWFAREPLVHLP